MTQHHRDKKHGGARLDTTEKQSQARQPSQGQGSPQVQKEASKSSQGPQPSPPPQPVPSQEAAAAQKKKKERLIMVVMIVLAAVMVLAATAAVLYTRWVKKPPLPSAEQPSTPLTTVRPSSSLDPNASEDLDEPDFDPVEPKVGGRRKSENFYTVLIFGADVTSGLTDTIMLGSYDVTNQKATIMSIPRDTQVNVRNKSSKSINAVYNANGKGEKGTKALMNEVSELVGFNPDYYVMIDWELVGKMVDAIGGVDFEIPWEMWYEDDTQNLHIEFQPGMQHLDGKDAMNLVRWRKNNGGHKTPGGGGDTSRLEVQHDFLKAVLRQTLQLKNVTKVQQLAQLFGENVVSDLSIENMLWFASQAVIGGLSVDSVDFVTMPYTTSNGKGIYANKVFPAQKPLLTLINESLNPFVEDVTIRELDLMRVSADGNTMSSSTGKLADPSVGVPPATSKPDESGKPDESDKPDKSEKPSHSSKPDESDKPDVSSRPSESSRPSHSVRPVESEEPSGSQPPDESSSPDVSSPPDVSDVPPESGEPVVHNSPAPIESLPIQDTPAPVDTAPPAEQSPPDVSTVPDWLQPDGES